VSLSHTGGEEVQHHLFFTSALDGQYPQDRTLLPIEEEAGSAPQLVWTVSENRKSLIPARIPTQKSNQLLVATLTTLVQNETKMRK
jgi:hypothetical protein